VIMRVTEFLSDIVSQLGIFGFMTGMTAKLKEIDPVDLPYRRANGVPGKTEWEVKKVLERVIEGVVIALIIWICTTLSGDRGMVLRAIKTMNSNVVALANASNENRDVINQLKSITWGHLDPDKRFPCPPDLKAVRIEEAK